MALPDFTAQDAATYKANIDGAAADHETRVTQNEADIADHETRVTQLEDETFELAAADAPAADTTFDATAITTGTWGSIGPTGSGADGVWTALDSVPSGALWVEVKLEHTVENNAGDSVSSRLYARKNGSSKITNQATQISYIGVAATGATLVKNSTYVVSKIPISTAALFDVYWTSNGSSEVIDLALVGWGY